MQKIKKKEMPHSMKKRLILWMIVFLIPIFIILTLCISFITKSYEKQMQAYVQQMISPFAAEMDAVLNLAMRYIAGKNVDFTLMDEALPEENLERIQKIEETGNQISRELSVQNGIDAVFLWNGKKIWFVQNYDESYVQNRCASLYLKEKLEKEEVFFQSGYQYFEANGIYYLFLTIDIDGGKIGCWFSQDSLLENIKKVGLEGLEGVVLEDNNGHIFYSEDGKEKEKIDQYFVSRKKLSSAPFSIVAFWNQDVIFQPFDILAEIVLFCLGAACILFVSYLFFVQKSVLRPLGRMASVIGNMKKKEIREIEIDPKEPAEVQSVFWALNDLISEVKDLKIRVYEEQIAEQETELQLYQLQLRPHFFLNILNSIISFARSKDYKMVQKMTMYLAGHCRYILYHTWYVSVEEELEYTQNYINMQQIQSGKESSYEENVQEEVLSCKIPILCVQIFVENALKYTRGCEKEIKISVHAEKKEKDGEEKLWITIDDTGNGFSQEQLILFETEKEKKTTGQEHGIGIINVRQRMNILYGDKAEISFSNNREGGAHVEMLMPFCEKNGKEENKK